jgi:hypothetical protein
MSSARLIASRSAASVPTPVAQFGAGNGGEFLHPHDPARPVERDGGVSHVQPYGAGGRGHIDVERQVHLYTSQRLPRRKIGEWEGGWTPARCRCDRGCGRAAQAT